MAPPRAGVSQSTTAPWTLAEDARAYADGGWSAIGVWLHKLERPTMEEFWFPEERPAAEAVESAAAAIGSARLDVSHVVLGGRFTEADDELRSQRVEQSVLAADVAARLGAACLVVVLGEAPADHDVRDGEARRRDRVLRGVDRLGR